MYGGILNEKSWCNFVTLPQCGPAGACLAKGNEQKTNHLLSQTTTSRSKRRILLVRKWRRKKKEEKKEVKKMDLEAIANGDYSSNAGSGKMIKENKLVPLTTKAGLTRVRGLWSFFDGLWNSIRRHLWWSWWGFLVGVYSCGSNHRSMIKDKSSLRDTSDASKNSLVDWCLVSLVLGNKARSTIK